MRWLAACAMPVLIAAGCRNGTNHSVLDPTGVRAGPIVGLWWFALAIATAVYAATVGALFWALWRARTRERRNEPLPLASDRRMTRGVAGALGVTVAILLTFFVYDLSVGRVLRTPNERPHVLVRVVGHQWWWDVQYPDSNPSRWISDANEIHIPTGRPVLVELTSHDVIHSLWIPNLGGKKDLIPRYTDTLWFQADTPGVYRSQCAEFCGLQHAKMALLVVAHAPADWNTWAAMSRLPSVQPSDTLAQRGKEVFLAGQCPLCHTIQGTAAGSRAGPDLTHIASRRTLAAGTVPNTKGNLAGWITDPQSIKPGTNMPSNALAPADLEALLAYLGQLK
jgi:cytochrome c oxidase subunit II